MSVCVLTIRDGRDEVHDRSMASLKEHFPEPAAHVIVDDRDHSLGFAGAIRKGWGEVLRMGCEWVFHHEADFLFRRPVPLAEMIAVLEARDYLTQMALKRQAQSPDELRAGGVVEADPDAFAEVSDGKHTWTEHRKFWTTNPSVYPVHVCGLTWPQESESEGKFWLSIAADLSLRSAYWGGKFDPPMVQHVGERVGVGY